jgi:hypothetical protein
MLVQTARCERSVDQAVERAARAKFRCGSVPPFGVAFDPLIMGDDGGTRSSISQRCAVLTVALATMLVVWLAGVSVNSACNGDAWNMDHSSSKAVRTHGFGRSVLSFCSLGPHEEQKVGS